MIIILLGYMGSGKSVVGKFLAKKLQIPCYDLDEEIEKIAACSIQDLFTTKGELYFRKLEQQVLNQFAARKTTFVLSLGGGTPCYSNNHEVLHQPNCKSFYLKASVATLVKRLSMETLNRPLLVDDSPAGLTDFISKHLFDRSFYYHQANHIIQVDDLSVAESAAAIIQKLA